MSDNLLTFLNKDSRLTIEKSAIIYLNETFDIDFDPELININIEENYGFVISMMLSYDNQNWTHYIKLNEISDIIDSQKEFCIQNNLEFKLYIKIVCKLIDKFTNSFSQINTNINQNKPIIIFEEINYNEIVLDKITVEYKFEAINLNPTFNLYNNSEIAVNRWLADCIATNQRNGWQVIYFKTEPVDEDVIDTLGSNMTREVVAIKKFMITVPDNQFPTDKIIYNEWDQAMSDEFEIHIVDELFKFIFGYTIPQQKDYMFIPLLNKIYTINSVQPGTKFYGATGWWECYLTKYEKDEIVKEVDIDSLLSHIRNNVESIPNLSEDDLPDIYAEFESMRDDGLWTNEKHLTDTIEEKKEVTENLNVKIVDNTTYISAKETQKQTEMYFKRPEIVSINKTTEKFPLTMYDNTTVINRAISMIYDLKDLTKINKFKTLINNQSTFKISFNLAFLKRYTNELFDVLSDGLIVFTIALQGKYLYIKYENKEFKIDYELQVNGLYYIEITDKNVLIYENKILKHNFENNIYNDNISWNLDKIYMYGGQYYASKLLLEINKNKIFEDKTTPILNFQNFTP